MKPSTLRYIRTEQDVWSLLWRIMPKQCRLLQNTKQTRISVQSTPVVKHNFKVNIV